MMMNKEDIEKLLPHRDPFLFVDSVVELEPGAVIVALKRFNEEDFFRGHFPGNPIVPGVIIVEALAQAGGILIYTSNADLKGKTPALVGLENVRFRKPIIPGNEVKLRVQILKKRSPIWVMKGEAFVGDTKVAEAEIMASLFQGE